MLKLQLHSSPSSHKARLGFGKGSPQFRGAQRRQDRMRSRPDHTLRTLRSRRVDSFFFFFHLPKSPRSRRPLRFKKLLRHLRQTSVHSSFLQINLDLKIRAAGYFMKPALTLEAAEAGLLFAHALAELFGAVPIADRDVALIP